MGMIKDRNGKDLTEAEEVKKRWQEYMEKLYNDNPVCETAKEMQMYRADLWTLWERERAG